MAKRDINHSVSITKNEPYLRLLATQQEKHTTSRQSFTGNLHRFSIGDSLTCGDGDLWKNWPAGLTNFSSEVTSEKRARLMQYNILHIT